MSEDLYIIYRNARRLLEFRGMQITSSNLSKDDLSTLIGSEPYVQINARKENASGGAVASATETSEQISQETIGGKHRKRNVPEGEYILVIFFSIYSVQANKIKAYLLQHMKQGLIFVTKTERMHESIETQLNNIMKEGEGKVVAPYIEYRLFSNLIMYFPDTINFIKFSFLTQEEIDYLKKVMRKDPAFLPKISAQDPNLFWYMAQPGDIVKVMLPGETSIDTKFLKVIS